MTKFRKGDRVAVLLSWNNRGNVAIRRGTVHSCGTKVMRLMDEKGEMFKTAFRPENNVMASFNGIRIIPDADNATLEAEALADGQRVNDLWLTEAAQLIALGDEFNVEVGERYIAERNEPSFIWL